MIGLLRWLGSLFPFLLALPFALIGWAWVCLRMMGACALVGALLGLVWNAVVMLEPLSIRHTVIGLLLGGFAGLVLALVKLIGPVSFGRRDPGTSHGSAAWASPRTLRQGLAAPALARDPAALLVGRAPGRSGGLLRHVSPAHLLTIAPTRSGKGVVEWPPFRPDTGRSHEDLGLRLGTRLCRTTRSTSKSLPVTSAAAAAVRSRSSGWSRKPCSRA